MLLSFGQASAQAPGYPPVDTRGIMAEYHAEVLDQINKVMDKWGKAWASDDVDDVVDLYWDNAEIITPDASAIRGRDEIRAYLETVLPEQGQMEAFMLDFDASGGMAMIYGNYQVTQDGTEQRGPIVTVYSSRGRTWKIRSQVFVGPGGATRP